MLNCDYKQQAMNMVQQQTSELMHECLAGASQLLLPKEAMERQLDWLSDHSPTTPNFALSCKYLSEPTIQVTEPVSLLHKHPRRDTLLTVFYFETAYHCTFDLSQLAPGTTIKKFIAIAVEQYCMERWRFTPDGIVTSTYEVKLAGLRNQHDPLIDPIDQDELLVTYAGNSLCLLRSVPKESNLSHYQKKLEEMCEVFQVDVHLQLHNEPQLYMNHIVQLPKGCSVGQLKNKLISGCGIIDLAEECVLVEYNQLIQYPLSLSTAKIPDRRFELMRIRHRIYLDQPDIQGCRLTVVERPGTQVSIGSDSSLGIRSNRLLHSQAELSSQLASEQPVSLDIDSGMRYFSGKCTLTIEGADLVQRTESSTLSKLVGYVWQRKPQQTFALGALLSVKADRQLLRLVFANKSETECKTYRVKDSLNCKRFVEQLLRRCRILRKQLAEWKD